LKETITILQQTKVFLNFYCHQKENISKIILEKSMALKEAKSCCPRPRTGQFLRTWRVRGQDQELDSWGQGQGLQKLSSRTRTSTRPPPLVITIAWSRFNSHPHCARCILGLLVKAFFDDKAISAIGGFKQAANSVVRSQKTTGKLRNGQLLSRCGPADSSKIQRHCRFLMTSGATPGDFSLDLVIFRLI